MAQDDILRLMGITQWYCQIQQDEAVSTSQHTQDDEHNRQNDPAVSCPFDMLFIVENKLDEALLSMIQALFSKQSVSIIEPEALNDKKIIEHSNFILYDESLESNVASVLQSEGKQMALPISLLQQADIKKQVMKSIYALSDFAA